MSIKKISIKVNNSKETIEQYSVTGGENGAGKLKQPLHINAQKDVNYLLIDESTQFAPENIAVKRVDKNLVIAFEGGDVESPDLIIENYFAENGAIGYQEGDANLIIGQYENGQYFPYVPESAVKADAISQLTDGQAAGQAIGGDALPPLWAFNPWWLAALVPLIGIPAVAISGGGGGGSHSKVVDHAPIAGDDSAHAKHNTPVTIHVTANDSDVDGDLNPNSIRIVKEGSKGTVTIGKDGNIIYTPKKGEYGVDTITYVIKDRAGHESNVATITVKIDAAPEAQDDSAVTKESKPVTIDMENNYSDKDGDVDHSSLAIKTNGGKGFAKFVNGKLVYQPNKGEVGTDTITYTVTDKNGNVSEDATITINIDAPPVANDDSAKANKATPVELDVLGNDTDLDGDIDPTTLEVVGEPTKGTVKVVDGKLVYTANPDATGQDTITYLVKDKNGNVSNKATVTIDITEPPVANEDEADTRHNTPVEIDITANDTDLDGDLDKNSVVITHPGTKGTVTIGEDGKLIYTPNKGEHGTDTIKYTIKDKNGNVSNEATVTITIDAPPVAGNDIADTRHNKPVEIDITANDTDLDGDLDKNSVVITHPGTKGTVTIGEDGKLIYTPNKGEHGTDTIKYTIKDKNGNVSEEATVTVTIDAPPIANKDSAKANKATPVEIDVLDNDEDLDGDIDPTTLEVVGEPTKGTVKVVDGKLVYTANPDATGQDTITYLVKDKNGNVSNKATVTIDITEPPVANKDEADTRHNTPVEIDITANDTDLDGDLDKNSVVITHPGTKGTVTIGEDGKLIYTPNKGEHGTDTITYQIKDKAGNISNEATVTVTIDAPPIANEDATAIKVGETVTLDVLANDTDLDGNDDIDPNTLTITNNGEKGTATIVDGKLVYTAKPGVVGTDTITYTVKDKNGNVSNETTVTIVIDAAPIANKDSAKANKATPVEIDVLDNDEDLDGDIDPTTLEVVDEPTKGTVKVVDGKLVYTANPDATGQDTITYLVKDKNGNVSNKATVTIDITEPPVANEDKADTRHNTPVEIDITANDTDLDGDLDKNSVVITHPGTKGTVTIGEDGKLIYTPNKGEHGTDTITYQIKDKAGNISNEATVTVTIDAPPIANEDATAIKVGETVTLDVLANDTDLDGNDDIDPNTLTITNNGEKGTATIVDGKLVYTAKPGVVGTDTITYTVKDKNGNVSNETTVTIVIDAAPIANKDSAKANKATPVEIDVLDNDEDLDGDIDPTTLEVVGEPTKGTVKVVDGKLVYTANPDATGQDTITYLVKDKNGNVSNKATVTIDITEPPVANKDEADTRHNTPVEIDITANDTDLDGDLDKNSVVITHPGTKGTVTIGEDGKLIYTPNKGEHGTDTIKYTVKDSTGNVSNIATVTIEIDAAPVATNDSGITLKDTPVTVDLRDNVSDLDKDADLSTLEIVSNGNKGKATIVDGKLVYTPNPGVTGTDTITYKVFDKNGNVSNTATVTISIKEKGSEAVDVYEKGLRTDGTAADSKILVDGKVILANPKDKPVAEQDIQITKPTTELTSGGKPITWESTDNGFVGKDADGKEVITLTANSTTDNGQTTVDYKVNLKGLVDHPAGKDSLNIEFGVKNGTDEVKTQIVVHDDKPSAADVELSVEPPAENTFYANVIISLDFSTSMDAEDSGIKGDDTRTGIKTRYDAALDAMQTLLDNYEERLNSADKGDVRISLNGFADKASAIHPDFKSSHDTSYWFSIDEAREIIDGMKKKQFEVSKKLGITTNTNYDDALQQIVDIYQNPNKLGKGPITDQNVDNTFFFISDGTPNMGNEPYGEGISAKSPDNYKPGDSYSDIGEDKWTKFLTENGIRSVAIGIGPVMVEKDHNGKTGEDYLKPVAFDGKKVTDNDGSDVIVLEDMSSLGNILSKYVPNENTIESSFSKANDGKETLSFGADGMKSISIEVDGHTYKYDPTTKEITSDNLDKSMWVDFGQGELAVKTDAGGLLSISLGEKNFGHLTYRPGATRPTGMEKETFTLTLTDNDGTSGKSSISVDISKLKESGNTGLNDTDLTALKLFSPESAMELHGVDTDVNATSSHSTGFMNSSLDALQETQSAII